jgi:hypothetical protein
MDWVRVIHETYMEQKLLLLQLPRLPGYIHSKKPIIRIWKVITVDDLTDIIASGFGDKCQ